MKKGANISVTRNGGLINTFCRPGTILVSPSALSALPSRFVASNVTRVVGCNYVGSDRFFRVLTGNSTLRRVSSMVRAYMGVGHSMMGHSRGRTKREVLLGFNRALNRTVRGVCGCANVARNVTITINVMVVAGTDRGRKLARTKATCGVRRIYTACNLPAASSTDLRGVTRTTRASGGASNSSVGIILLRGVNADFAGGITVSSLLSFVAPWRNGRVFWLGNYKDVTLSASGDDGPCMQCLPFMPGNRMGVPPSGDSIRHTVVYTTLAENGYAVTPITLSGSVGTAVNIVRSVKYATSVGSKILAISNAGVFGASGMALSYNRDNDTLQFFVPMTTTNNVGTAFVNRKGLPREPVKVFARTLPGTKMGYRARNNLPLGVDNQLRDKAFRVPNGMDSRFVAKLLLTLPLIGNSDSVILASPVRDINCVGVAVRAVTRFNIRVRAASGN